MKKLLLCLSAVALTAPAFAWHYGPYHHWHGGCYHHHGYHANDFWVGAGVGLVGGLVGAAVYNAVKPDPPRVVLQPQPVVVQQQPVVVQQPAPVVVQQPAPVVVQQQPVVLQQTVPPSAQAVWIPGRYASQTQANGTVVQVWQPGHYESR